LSGVGLVILGLWWVLGAALLANDPPWSFLVALYAFALAGTGVALIFPPPVRELYFVLAVLLPVIPYVLGLVIAIAIPHGLSTNVPLSSYVVLLVPATPALLALIAWRAGSGNISGN
jgi:hypothetical protein